MATLNVPLPRFKPTLTQADMGAQTQQPQQVLREAPVAPVAQNGSVLTPEQVARKRAIAEQLAQSGMDYSPVQHWTQGLARVANALAGSLEESRADEAEKQGKKGAQDDLTQLQAMRAEPDADPKSSIAMAMALADNPWASKVVQSYLGAEMARQNPEMTPEQLNYQAAQKDPNFADYQMKLRAAGSGMPPSGYQVAPDGKGFTYIPGGPADPTRPGGPGLSPPGKPISGTMMKDIEDVGGKLQAMSSFSATFQPRFAGGGSQVIGKGAGNFLQNYVPDVASFISDTTGLDTSSPEAADWWRNYQAYKNEVRHSGFGASLTATEKAEFDKQTISPEMDPERVRKALASQQAIIERAVARKQKMMQAQGYNMEAVNAGLGIDDAAPLPAQTEELAPSPSGDNSPPPPPQAAIPPAAIQRLMANPHEADLFDQQFGPGASAQYLKGGQGGPEQFAPLPPENPDPYGLQDITRQRKEMTARHQRMLTKP